MTRSYLMPESEYTRGAKVCTPFESAPPPPMRVDAEGAARQRAADAWHRLFGTGPTVDEIEPNPPAAEADNE